MYQFQVTAYTQAGESIGIVGSTPELGLWDITKCVHLRTSGDCYPLWWTDQEINFQPSLSLNNYQRVEYKYVRIDAKGHGQWEAMGANRWLPINPEEQSGTIVVDDGAYGYLQPYAFGYFRDFTDNKALKKRVGQSGQFENCGDWQFCSLGT